MDRLQKSYMIGMIVGLLLGVALGGASFGIYHESHPKTITKTIERVKWYRIDEDTKHFIMGLSGDFDTDIKDMIAIDGGQDT